MQASGLFLYKMKISDLIFKEEESNSDFLRKIGLTFVAGTTLLYSIMNVFPKQSSQVLEFLLTTNFKNQVQNELYRIPLKIKNLEYKNVIYKKSL